MQRIIRALAIVYACCVSDGAVALAADHQAQPTIVLVHGAFAESSSWNSVIAELNRQGNRTIAAANPLRGIANDAAAISAVIGSIRGSVLLVGHSHGGPVIPEAAKGKDNAKALVYVAGFAPDKGESSLTLAGQLPGSTLGAALLRMARLDGGQDLHIQPEKFHEQFAAEVPAAQASLMATTQRLVAEEALGEASDPPSWKTISSYSIYGSADRNIPPEVVKFMAERAHSLKTIIVEGGSHALMVSHPGAVAPLIDEATSAQ